MNSLNRFVAIVLGLATAGMAAFFFLGSQEQHALLLQQGLWSSFAWRFYGFGVLGLIGAAGWWLVNALLLKTGIIKGIKLGRAAILLASGPVLGSLLGTLLFCFA
jgi:uncharacterized membrane protein YqjE